MFEAEVKIQGDVLHLRLAGVLDETFSVDLPPNCPKLKTAEVHCKGVSRINSVGVKFWLRFFTKLSQGGTRIIYRECATVIVEQFNLIKNFNAGGGVESIQVPYSCDQCHGAFVGLFKVEQIVQAGCQIADAKCPKCGGIAKFDDFPEEYFAFLKRDAEAARLARSS